MYNYFPFTIISDYTGTYSAYSSTSFNIPLGNICQPSDILKFNSGTDSWNQIPSTYTFLNTELDITSLNSTDWSTTLKDKWFDDYLRYVNMYNYLTPTEKTSIYNYFISKDIFQDLSSPSVAYVTRNDGTNGLIIDPLLINNEVSIGLNVYELNYVLDYANTLPNNNTLKNKIFTYLRKDKNLVSNVCKVKYKGFEDCVWCFDGIEYKDYDISNIGIIPSLTNGGGNIFGELKMSADYIQAHYIVKKNVDVNDPTFGLCSGGVKPFCIGDSITIVDTSSLSSFNSTSGFTWIGDYTQIPFTFDFADVTKPCEYYSNTPIYDLLIPFRIIQFCLFENFG